MNKKSYLKFFLIHLPIFVFFTNVYALAPETHKDINSYIAIRTLNQFSLNQYLENQLGFKDGVETSLISKEVYGWLGEGGVKEDLPYWYMPYLRSVNHFHNPLETNIASAGFSGIWGTGILSGESSILWSQKPTGQQSPGGHYSWHDVREYFFRALTSTDGGARDFNFTQTFRGLGQIMHLVEDLSVPEHVRDDGHYFPAYEHWVKDSDNVKIDPEKGILTVAGIDCSENGVECSPIFFDQAALGNQSRILEAPISIANLFDTDQYDGSNPNITVRSDIGLAEFTNANFVSADTIFSDKFPYPSKNTSVDIQDRNILNPLSPGNAVKRPYYVKIDDGDSGYLLAGVDYLYVYREIEGIGEEEIDTLPPMDDYVFEDYAKRLIPRAVGYSASLLNYFFRGKLQAAALPVFLDNSIYAMLLNIKNVTPSEEQMTNGIFTVVVRYTPAGGNPDGSDDIFVRSNDVQSGDLQYNEASDVLFYLPRLIPLDNYDSVKCMLVYRGKLGNEENCVIGKAFPLGDIRFNEEWDNGLDGNYPWNHTVADENPDNGSTSNVVNNGALVKDNLRFIGHATPRFNNSHLYLIDVDNPSGLRITPDTCLQFKIDDLSINEQPPSPEGSTTAWQYLSFDFNNGLALQFSYDGQGVFWDSNTGYYTFTPGGVIVLNVHTLFQISGIAIPEPFFLESINLTQQLWNLNEASTVEHQQHMEVDFIRIVERYNESE